MNNRPTGRILDEPELDSADVARRSRQALHQLMNDSMRQRGGQMEVSPDAQVMLAVGAAVCDQLDRLATTVARIGGLIVRVVEGDA